MPQAQILIAEADRLEAGGFNLVIDIKLSRVVLIKAAAAMDGLLFI